MSDGRASLVVDGRRLSASPEGVRLAPAGLAVQNLWALRGASVGVATDWAARWRLGVLPVGCQSKSGVRGQASHVWKFTCISFCCCLCGELHLSSSMWLRQAPDLLCYHHSGRQTNVKSFKTDQNSFPSHSWWTRPKIIHTGNKIHNSYWPFMSPFSISQPNFTDKLLMLLRQTRERWFHLPRVCMCVFSCTCYIAAIKIWI